MTANTAVPSKHVLVVTADAAYAESCRTELPTREGLHVETTDTVDAAMGRLKQEDDIDCVISDHDLPDVDAIAFLEAVRIEFPDVPFILFTSEGSERVASRAIHAGVTDYLIKERHRDQWDQLDTLINKSIDYHRTRSEIIDPRTQREVLLGAIPDMVGVLQDGTFLYVNPAGVELTGVDSQAELIGTALFDLFAEENELTRENLDAVQRGDRYINATAEQLIDVSGDEIPVEVTVSRIPWEGAEAMLAILTDRSERVSLVHRLRELKRITSVMRRLNRILVHAASRAEIDKRVCELISDSDTYRFAWIGKHDDATGDVVAGAWAGIEKGYLDDITITTGEEQTAQGPTGQAIRTREIQVMQDIPNDPRYEPWREEALDRGYRSSAAIPLVFEDELYGVLSVYADRVGAFDQQERDLLREVGDDIAFAYHRLDLRDELRQLQAAIEQAADAIFLTDTEGTIEYVNPAFEALTGYSADEAVGRNPRILKSGELDDAYYEKMWETILAGEIWSSEIVNKRKSGERYCAEQTVAPITNDGVEGFVAIQRDITERKALETDLRRSRELLTQTEELAKTGGFEIDIETDELQWTDGTYRLHDLSPDGDFEPTIETGMSFFHPDDRDTIESVVNRCIERGEEYDIEVRLVTAEDRVRWVRTAGIPIRSNGEIVKVQGWIGDITERKRLEDDLKESITQLQVIDRVLRHNLHNDMNVIQGYAETIQSETDGDLADMAAKIVKESSDLLTTVDKERQITKLLSEQHQQKSVALDRLIDTTVAEIQQHYQAAEITVAQPDGVTVSATYSLDLALNELLTNAVKHSDRDSPTIVVTVEDRADTVSIHIADDGPGIPEMEQRILSGEAAIEPLYHGSGLGLWLVKLIVQKSGGDLSFGENDPRGSIVTIELKKTQGGE